MFKKGRKCLPTLVIPLSSACRNQDRKQAQFKVAIACTARSMPNRSVSRVAWAFLQSRNAQTFESSC